MLAFIDESGDTGRKTDKGSSAYFAVSMVLFLDHEEALACDRCIDALRAELRKPVDFEFHYSRNSEKVATAFVEAVRPYTFSIITVAINKDPAMLWGDGFMVKSSFYKYACHMVVTNALPYLDRATIILDKSGSGTFQAELAAYLKKKFNNNFTTKIKKVKQQDSARNNLLQLADYSASILHRHLRGKSVAHYQTIASKVSLQMWPQKNI